VLVKKRIKKYLTFLIFVSNYQRSWSIFKKNLAYFDAKNSKTSELTAD